MNRNKNLICLQRASCLALISVSSITFGNEGTFMKCETEDKNPSIYAIFDDPNYLYVDVYHTRGKAQDKKPEPPKEWGSTVSQRIESAHRVIYQSVMGEDYVVYNKEKNYLYSVPGYRRAPCVLVTE
jgi:hypothetical protein